MPQSYGVFSHLWASVAQESARSTPSSRCRREGSARAHNPKAPSTCSQTPGRRRPVDHVANLAQGVYGAAVHVARLGADDRRPVQLLEHGSERLGKEAPGVVYRYRADGAGARARAVAEPCRSCRDAPGRRRSSPAEHPRGRRPRRPSRARRARGYARRQDTRCWPSDRRLQSRQNSPREGPAAPIPSRAVTCSIAHTAGNGSAMAAF